MAAVYLKHSMTYALAEADLTGWLGVWWTEPVVLDKRRVASPTTRQIVSLPTELKPSYIDMNDVEIGLATYLSQ